MGTYTLVSYDYISDIHIPDDDVIFYNFSAGHGQELENKFLSLFDCRICYTANKKILDEAKYYSYNFYEDERYAVIFEKGEPYLAVSGNKTVSTIIKLNQ